MNIKNIYKLSLKNKNKIFIAFILLTFFLCFPFTNVSAQSNDDCLTCHSDNTLTAEKNGKEVSLFVNEKTLAKSPHAELTCVSCHVGFNMDEIPHKENIQPINCTSCHTDAGVLHPFHPQMLNAKGTETAKNLNCKGCHGTHNIVSPEVKGSKFYKDNLVNACGNCHADEKQHYSQSAHYKGIVEGVTGAPNCFTCHKNSITNITARRDSAGLKLAQEKLCLSCHLDNPEIRARTSPSAGFIYSYEKSIHGLMLKNGNAKAANCVDCHTGHHVENGNSLQSSVNKFNIPNTCSKCHAEIAAEYKQSIHGVAVLEKGIADAPVCTDCHGEHNILKHNDPESPVNYANVSKQVCTPCHSSLKLTRKYGLQPNRGSTFENSYHGLALRGGSVEVANCASCHGVHNIKPPSDPASTVNPKNLAKTCGTCHPGANENFTKGKIHVTMAKEDDPILYWISTIYIFLIISIIGGMVIHNIFDFVKKSKIKKMKQLGLVKEEYHGHSLYLRMTLNERLQHIALAFSFIMLVVTGFMLHFPDSWWVKHIREFSENAFIYRSNLHRISAVIMVLASLYHIYYAAFTKRGRQLIKDLFPRFQDLKDAIGIAKFNIGLSKKKPKLDRFCYVEKAEYWALVWGTIVMTVTGTIMWFDNTFIGILTKLGWDIARTVHYYEAWLAFLAILIWHFYFVIFSPDAYPMNLSWITGNLTEEEMAEEHALELEKIKQQEAEKKSGNNSIKEEEVEFVKGENNLQ